MVPWKGDLTVGQTVFFPFNSSNASGASVTVTNFVVGDIKVYKNGGTTQRTSSNGITLLDTDGIDFDGATGCHGFKIDTSDNTDAGFYAAGNDYQVMVDAITIDGQTVRWWVGEFSIQNRYQGLTTAQVNAEVVDALATDTYAEPGQGAPAATTSLAAKINYLYKAFRNKKTQDATDFKLYADDGTTVDQKAATSEAAGLFTQGELGSGP